MDVLTVAAVLSLLSVSAAKPQQKCEDLIQPIALNLTQVLGKWIVIEGTADHPTYRAIQKTVNSSWMDSALSSDNNPPVLNIKTMYNGKCHYLAANMTVSNNTYHVAYENGSFTGVALPSCPDCLALRYTSVDNGITIKSLYIFGRTKKLNESDLEMYREQVKCVGLPQPMFKYDGKQDLCPDTEKPADEVKDGDKQ